MASKDKKGIQIGIDKNEKSEKQKAQDTKNAMNKYNSALNKKISKGK